MTNFDFLKQDKQFETFADTAISAERIFNIDIVSSVVACRRAMEFAVKWVYSVDKAINVPYQDKLISLINTDDFKKLVGNSLYRKLDYIRLLGNNANHSPKNISKDQAMLALENLHIFMNFIYFHYGAKYQQTAFNPELLINHTEKISLSLQEGFELKDLYQLNKNQVSQMTERRAERENKYKEETISHTEASTRKAYIDVMLTDVGWELNKNWINEYPIEKMPNKAGTGFADYVLFGDDGKPLAVIEAKKTSVDVEKGRQQAKLYADDLERRFGQRPIIFLTNGYDTKIWIDTENGYPERRVSGIYSKRDLEKEFNKMNSKSKLTNITINDHISGRYYQKEAIKNVCESFDKNNKRKALLVMATGSGKTRTVISLVDVLMQNGWIKNFLFLADRNSLVTQAKRAFHNLMPDLSVTNLVDEKDNYNARGVFSTYQTIINCIDDTKDEEDKKLYSCGHFDLIIIDEAHRSIYNKYKDIFNYFDAILIGLTATPKNEIDKNTYNIFELEDEVPTYAYELKKAVEDGYLVGYNSIETKLNLVQNGIVYDELSEKDKQQYDELFEKEEYEIPKSISPSEINTKIFNEDTIEKVLHLLLTTGLKVEYGNKIGKTVIFAKSHLHAEKILNVWNKQYPHYPQHFCRVIDNYTNYSQSLIDDFSTAGKLPQIAISVDMLDTGIDIPEILNLVFFKKVLSISKFWQMIGRGTRLCEGLIDGNDKKEFYIFDFCSNFEFFRINKNDKEATSPTTIQEQLFNLKTNIIFKLQNFRYQTEFLIEFRNNLIDELLEKISKLNRKNFAVVQHIKFIDKFSKKNNYNVLTYQDVLSMEEHIAPLIEPETYEFTALRFDALMYGLELAYIVDKNSVKMKKDLFKKTEALMEYGTIPDVIKQKDLIEKLILPGYIDKIKEIKEFEHIRINLRNLMKYIEKKEQKTYDTDFTETIIEINQNEPDYTSTELENYEKKVAFYIKQHEDNPSIMKIKYNKPLTKQDMLELEKILWHDLGTKEDYQEKFKNMPLGELVRSIVGLDMQAAKEAFSKFIDKQNLDTRQIYFVNQIINHFVHNGLLTDFSIFQESPFNDKGNFLDLFGNQINVWNEIRNTIEQINSNATYKQE